MDKVTETKRVKEIGHTRELRWQIPTFFFYK